MPSQTIALIPARAGSKGLPGKNIRNLSGKPLYRHSVDAALAAGISRIFISTDIPEISKQVLPEGVTIIPRPRHLAGDHVKMSLVISAFIERQLSEPATIIVLQPTSPLRTAEHIDEALRIFSEGKYTLVMSVCEADQGVLKWGLCNKGYFTPLSDPAFCFENRQNLPKVYRPNGGIYIFRSKDFMHMADFPTKEIGIIEMTKRDSLDVDTLDDFLQCERLIAEGS